MGFPAVAGASVPLSPFAGAVAGTFRPAPFCGSSGAAGGPYLATRAWALSFWTDSAGVSFDAWRCYVATLSTTGHLEVGIYTSTPAGYPDVLLAPPDQIPDVRTGFPGDLVVAAMAVPFDPVAHELYYIGVKLVSTDNLLRMMSTFSSTLLGWAALEAARNLQAGSSIWEVTGLAAAAALPATFPAGGLHGNAGGIPIMPSIEVRAVADVAP